MEQSISLINFYFISKKKKILIFDFSLGGLPKEKL